MKTAHIALAGLLAGVAVASSAETDVAMRIDAGLWEITATETSGDKAGAPSTGRRCLSSEMAAKGPEAMLLDGQPECSVTRSAMTGGKLDALLQCDAGTDKATTVAITASFAPKSYEAVSKIVVLKTGAPTTVDVTAKWVGACSS